MKKEWIPCFRSSFPKFDDQFFPPQSKVGFHFQNWVITRTSQLIQPILAFQLVELELQLSQVFEVPKV
jgi:hypothetical protein